MEALKASKFNNFNSRTIQQCLSQERLDTAEILILTIEDLEYRFRFHGYVVDSLNWLERLSQPASQVRKISRRSGWLNLYDQWPDPDHDKTTGRLLPNGAYLHENRSQDFQIKDRDNY